MVLPAVVFMLLPEFLAYRTLGADASPLGSNTVGGALPIDAEEALKPHLGTDRVRRAVETDAIRHQVAHPLSIDFLRHLITMIYGMLSPGK